MKSRLIVRFILLFSAVAVATASASAKKTPGNNAEEAIKSLEATLERKLDQLMALVNATSCCAKPISKPEPSFASCKEIYNNQRAQENRAYLLQMPSGKVPVFCHMSSHGLGACGGGGWTLVMKIDGKKTTFGFNAKLWSNKVDFNLQGGKTGFDNLETKLPTYWNTPFSKICLGMNIGQQIKFVVINKSANSLYSLIADGQYRATSLGRDTWKTLIGSKVSLQPNCNKEGFNTACTYGKTRIGIHCNDENDCVTCDSRIGFGISYTLTCGNKAWWGYYNRLSRHVNIKAMGYILVQ